MTTVALPRPELKAEAAEKATLLLEALNVIMAMGDTTPRDIMLALTGTLAFVWVSTGHPEIAKALDNMFDKRLEWPESMRRTEEGQAKVNDGLILVVFTILEVHTLRELLGKNEQAAADRAVVLINALGSVIYNVVETLGGTEVAEFIKERMTVASEWSVAKAVNEMPGSDTVN